MKDVMNITTPHEWQMRLHVSSSPSPTLPSHLHSWNNSKTMPSAGPLCPKWLEDPCTIGQQKLNFAVVNIDAITAGRLRNNCAFLPRLNRHAGQMRRAIEKLRLLVDSNRSVVSKWPGGGIQHDCKKTESHAWCMNTSVHLYIKPCTRIILLWSIPTVANTLEFYLTYLMAF